MQYEARHAGVRYHVRYRSGSFSIESAAAGSNDWRTLAELALPARSDEETNVILHVLTDYSTPIPATLAARDRDRWFRSINFGRARNDRDRAASHSQANRSS